MQKKVWIAWLRRHPLAILVAVAVIADICIVAVFLRTAPHNLRVTFLNVGQGDAVFVEGPNGNQLLYDAGPPSGAVLRELSRVMPFWDRSIDVAVFSHPDMDHIGGFIDVFARYKVDLAITDGAKSDNGVYAESEKSIIAEGAKHLIAHRGMTIDLGGGAEADVLYPDHDTTSMETNSASIVLRIRYGKTAFLLSGDLPENIENYVVGLDGEKLHANVLKLGHHGSRTSSGVAWLSAVHPDIAVISAGKNNRYGHPHKETLERLLVHHIPFARTDTDGDVSFESNGEVVERR